MDLIVTELDTTLDQELTSSKPQFIRHIRPWVYIEGTPGGDLEIEIRNAANDTVLATSNAVSVATIKAAFSATDNYTHGLYRFDVDFGAQENTTYNIRLKGVNGYTFGASDFVGWNRDFDWRIYSASYSPNVGFDSAFTMEVWTDKDLVKGSR